MCVLRVSSANLKSDHYNVYTDVNECVLGTDSCAHNCHNTVGSYRCSCNTGYTLNRDRYTCDGTL